MDTFCPKPMIHHLMIEKLERRYQVLGARSSTRRLVIFLDSMSSKHCLVVLVVSASVVIASCRCGSDEIPVVDTTDGATVVDGGAVIAEAGVTPPSKSTPEKAPPEEELDGTLSVEIRDFQLFHPDSTSRALLDPTDLTKVTKQQASGFAIGLVIEARNNSPFVLDSPRIISDLRLTGLHGTVKCQPEPTSGPGKESGLQAKIVSSGGGEKGHWVDESRDPIEAAWRPHERIRISVVVPCGPAHIYDLELDGLEGSFTVAARPPYASSDADCDRAVEFCDDDVIGASPMISLFPRVASLQLVKLDSGGTAYSSGDMLISAEEGRLVRESLADRRLSLLEVDGADLPANPPDVQETIDEWALDVSKISLQHWADVPGTPKGKRVLRVSAEVAFDSKALERRLRAEIDASKQVDADAREKLQKARAVYEKALGGDEAASQEAQAKLREAEAASRVSTASLSKSLTAYERTLRSERTRLGRLLACDRVELVTHKRNLRAINAAETATLCRTLESVTSAQVEWVYQLDRYEIPIGLAFTAGTEPRVVFFAAKSLTTFDPR